MKQLYIKYLFLFFYINLPTFIDEEPNNSSLFTDVLLGNDHKGNQKSKQSIFEQCEDGIILFEQIEHLPYSSQNLLATILKKKMYQPSSSPSLLPLNAMVIITSSLSDTNPEISAITNAGLYIFTF